MQNATKPDTEERKNKWLQKDLKAQSVLVRGLSDNVIIQVITCESTKVSCNKLLTMYEQTPET